MDREWGAAAPDAALLIVDVDGCLADHMQLLQGVWVLWVLDVPHVLRRVEWCGAGAGLGALGARSSPHAASEVRGAMANLTTRERAHLVHLDAVDELSPVGAGDSSLRNRWDPIGRSLCRSMGKSRKHRSQSIRAPIAHLHSPSALLPAAHGLLGSDLSGP